MAMSNLLAAMWSGAMSISPSKVNRPVPEVSKTGLVTSIAPNTEVTKSLSTPVLTDRCPWILLSRLIAAIPPSKSSTPLETSSLSRARWPLDVGAPTARASFSGTPFTVASPSISNGPSNERTVAPPLTFSAEKCRLERGSV